MRLAVPLPMRGGGTWGCCHHFFTMNAIFCIIWGIFVLGGTAYLVGWHGWSPWWFALAVILLFKPVADSEE